MTHSVAQIFRERYTEINVVFSEVCSCTAGKGTCATVSLNFAQNKAEFLSDFAATANTLVVDSQQTSGSVERPSHQGPSVESRTGPRTSIPAEGSQRHNRIRGARRSF